jgi:hypothetical protein
MDMPRVTLPSARNPESRAAAEEAVASGSYLTFAAVYFAWCVSCGYEGLTRDEAIVAMSGISGKDENNNVRGRTRDFLACGLLERRRDGKTRLTPKNREAGVLVVPEGADFKNYRPYEREVPLHLLEDHVLPLIDAWRTYLNGGPDEREARYHEVLGLYKIDPNRNPPTRAAGPCPQDPKPPSRPDEDEWVRDMLDSI